LRNIIIIIVFIFSSSYINSQNDSCKIINYIHILGINDNSDPQHNDFRILDSLCNYPTLSVKILIDELKPIKKVIKITPEKYDKYKSQTHIIWCIRALRHMTGLDFTSKTNYRFRKNEGERQEQLSRGGEDNEIALFGVRMSHDVIFIAPIDAQIDIINQWKKWYKANKNNIILNILNDLNDWYF
jgi:hypothetical protein